MCAGDSAAKGRNSSARNIEFGSANVGLRQEKDENTSAKVTEGSYITTIPLFMLLECRHFMSC